LSIQITRWARR